MRLRGRWANPLPGRKSAGRTTAEVAVDTDARALSEVAVAEYERTRLKLRHNRRKSGSLLHSSCRIVHKSCWLCYTTKAQRKSKVLTTILVNTKIVFVC